VLPYHRPLSAAVDGDDVDAVELLDLRTGERSWRTGTFVLDATETGLLLRLGGVEHRVGAESREETGEPHAAQTAEPHNQQALSMCFALDHLEGEDHTIDKPDSYARWREYEPSNWSGPLLSFIAPDPRSLAPVERTFTPNGSPPAGPADHRAGGGDLELWDFRRIIARDNFETGAFASDVTLVNWPMIDYFEGPIVGVHESESTRHLESARELSRSFLYWLQTEAPRSDGGAGWPGLRLRGDVFGTADGLAKTPYIRESRRIEAQLTVTELHVGVQASGQRGPVVFDDSVGVGCYRIDLHPSTGGDPYIDVAARPFTIPLRSLIPVRMRNLLPAAKNIGVTHVSNGCFRLHPTEFNVGEAAGALAAFCIMRRTEPAAVAETGALLGEFQNVLAASGVELGWPKVVAY
jgi:hypothetical protein